MSLSDEQQRTLAIVERSASVLSILGVLTIILTFSFSRHFRNPIQRLIFINAFYNLFDFAATMISLSGPDAGNRSALCQFQGFCLQMFPLADVFWTLATALDVFLVVFKQYDAEALRKLEMKYIGIITPLVFIPALTFLFINTEDRGPMYSSVILWCSISPKWVLFRILFYYGPIWVVIAIILILYFLIGLEIFKLKGKFEMASDNRIELASTISTTNVSFDQTDTSFKVNASKPLHISDSHDTHRSSLQQLTPSQAPPSRSITLKLPKQSPVSFRHYLLMPVIFFLILLATWVAPTINRVEAFATPGHESYPLLLAVGAMGSLRGFWNGVLFIAIGMKGWKRQKRLEKKLFPRPAVR
ncbi:hypothetical protein ASPWEDRAFT_739296 [Aspergillus wentii DTO 134E9]|uniref:G-protein coupled receptors family 2 profile 2 domain-containing protein n=1 Tax=Aspergillus wentii DTO 134E9 TaxID=1073089 RepID=A0A1L9RSV6_ASPWE|nr:uncharacterized protein ASPWEDRAFT_739296 [Aspergillus wentii DTO 134E9]KAI9930821.1 hypothetical protein MW887_011579 [Aspergillus wentii]OJJ38000.1 hypothetical protein ASPWEDRAFT_739296 [Aspergillus wentii DTO 134E9]